MAIIRYTYRGSVRCVFEYGSVVIGVGNVDLHHRCVRSAAGVRSGHGQHVPPLLLEVQRLGYGDEAATVL